MNAVVVAIVSVGLVGISLAVGWLIMGFNRTRTKTEQITKVLDAIIVLEKADAAKQERIEEIKTEMQRTERVYAGYFEAIRIRMTEFDGAARTFASLQSRIEKMDEKMDEREKESVDFRSKIVDGLHAINLKLAESK